MHVAYCQKFITETESPDVICIVETWLSNDISDNELVIRFLDVTGIVMVEVC